MDALIPSQWRLTQCADHQNLQPEHYPVFIKPEWGQNSQGIVRADNEQQLIEHRQARLKDGPRYLIQSAAKGQREFEIFYVPGAQSDQSSAIISITETCNSSDDAMPINGINNKHTSYRSCMPVLSEQQLEKLEHIFGSIGDFKIARYCARADSLTALLEQDFSIVEINIYVPMPLILLAKGISFSNKIKFVLATMRQLALVTKDIPASQAVKSVFFKKLTSARLLKAVAKK